MKTNLGLLILTFWCALTALAIGRPYDDLAKWAEGNKASARQFLTDLSRSTDAHGVALAVRARDQHERASRRSLIEIVHHHPELRCVPELSLTNEEFRKWAQNHPDAAARRATVPKEAFTITQEMRLYLSDLLKSKLAAQAIPKLSKYMKDPEVVAARKEQQAALQADKPRIMELFQW